MGWTPTTYDKAKFDHTPGEGFDGSRFHAYSFFGAASDGVVFSESITKAIGKAAADGVKISDDTVAEYITNGSFETGDPPTSWSAYGSPTTFERSSTRSWSGLYSAHVVASAASQGFQQNIGAVLTVGRTYRIRARIWMVSGSLYVTSNFGFASGNISTTGQWLEVNSTFVATATGSGIYVVSLAAAEFYVDVMSLTVASVKSVAFSQASSDGVKFADERAIAFAKNDGMADGVVFADAKAVASTASFSDGVTFADTYAHATVRHDGGQGHWTGVARDYDLLQSSLWTMVASSTGSGWSTRALVTTSWTRVASAA